MSLSCCPCSHLSPNLASHTFTNIHGSHHMRRKPGPAGQRAFLDATTNLRTCPVNTRRFLVQAAKQPPRKRTGGGNNPKPYPSIQPLPGSAPALNDLEEEATDALPSTSGRGRESSSSSRNGGEKKKGGRGEGRDGDDGTTGGTATTAAGYGESKTTKVAGRSVEEEQQKNGFLLLLVRKTTKRLSSLPLAIAELAVVAALSALGTVLEQDRSPFFYLEQYSEGAPFLGVFNGEWILTLGLDHIYSSPGFLSLLILLAASLISCTSTRQWPIVRVARRWSFAKKVETVERMEVAAALPRGRLGDLATLLATRGYQVFARGPSLYGFKGLAGRFAPIAVHAALLLIMVGGTQTVLGGYKGTTMTPQGLDFLVGDALRPATFLSRPPEAMDARIVVNRFFIDYRPDGSIAQFHSDLSVFDADDREVARKTIAVNEPLRYGGVTAYQTDWSIAAIQLRSDKRQATATTTNVQQDSKGGAPFRLPMAKLPQPGDPDAKLFGTFLPLSQEDAQRPGGTPRGITILATDLEQVVLYDADGAFVGVRRPGSKRPITINGEEIIIDDLIGATGLELKVDPGVPLVYAGFGGLMLTTCLSYLSHSQVWALQEGETLFIGGRSNRAKVDFRREIEGLLDQVPEVITQVPAVLQSTTK